MRSFPALALLMLAACDFASNAPNQKPSAATNVFAADCGPVVDPALEAAITRGVRHCELRPPPNSSIATKTIKKFIPQPIDLSVPPLTPRQDESDHTGHYSDAQPVVSNAVNNSAPANSSLPREK